MTDPVYTDELEEKLDVYERGRVLRTVPNDAWEIIFATIHSYVEDADLQVRDLRPGDPGVIAAQASLYAMNKFETFFRQDTEAAMQFSEKPPKEFTEYMYQVRDRLDVLKQQGE